MKNIITRFSISFIALLFICPTVFAQKKERLLKGMYMQWGYNREAYTKSSIRFDLANGDKFTVHNAKAHDKPDFDDITKKPLEISLPQYNYRIGFYLNDKRSKSLELNFDHIKYVVTDYQTAHVTGQIGGQQVNGDSVLNATTFFHLEHTDGGNLLHLNYVQQNTMLRTKGTKRPILNTIWKAGAGVNIPRTDFTYHGDEFNNDFHVAGYNISVEAGARLYPLRRLFLELTGKTGYAHYINALANTKALKGNRVHHGFGYVEGILTLGYDIHF